MQDIIRYIDLYEYYIGRITGYVDWSYNATPSDIKVAGRFHKFVKDNNGGCGLVFRFFSYQFHRWAGIQRNRMSIRFNWIVGQKAIKRYKDNIDDLWYSYSSDLGRDFGVERVKVYAILGCQMSVDKDAIIGLEQRIRGDMVLINCLDLTSGFIPNGDVCTVCQWAELCKSVSK